MNPSLSNHVDDSIARAKPSIILKQCLLSRTLVKGQEMMIDMVGTNFNVLSKSKSFHINWVEAFAN